MSFIVSILVAFQIGTGFGLNSVQHKIDQLEAKAIMRQSFSNDESKWLAGLYRTLAYGAQAILVLPESARLMHHYLDGSGDAISIDTSLFKESPRVQRAMKGIKARLLAKCIDGTRVQSHRFDMGHSTPWDAVVALYFGTIEGKLVKTANQHEISWRVNMPWRWPRYEELKKKYGRYHAENFHLPNALSVLGYGRALMIDNGLGGHLETLGLAKSFETKTIWSERVKCGSSTQLSKPSPHAAV
jgi:hypothetical protein